MKRVFLVLILISTVLVSGCSFNSKKEDTKIVISQPTKHSLDDYKNSSNDLNSGIEITDISELIKSNEENGLGNSTEITNTDDNLEEPMPKSRIYIPPESSTISSSQSVKSTPSPSSNTSSSSTASKNSSSKAEQPFDGVYCANVKTKKFHKSICGSAKRIKDDNLYKTTSKEELLNEGYQPCQMCNP